MLIEKTLLLTRPITAAKRFDIEVRKHTKTKFQTIFSPIINIEPTGDWPKFDNNTQLILTSAHAVRGDLAGCNVFCVGTKTAAAATNFGASVLATFETAQELLSFIILEKPATSFFYLCGSHQTLAFADILPGLGIDCTAIQVYTQRHQPLNDEARTALKGESLVVLPLFSRRSAELVGREALDIAAKLDVIVISAEVGAIWKRATSVNAFVSSRPTGPAMVEKVLSVMSGQAG